MTSFIILESDTPVTAELVPVNLIDSLTTDDLTIPIDSAARFSLKIPNSTNRLDFLFVRRESETLQVSFHGALDRHRYSLPRFERFATLLKFNDSLLFFSDPTLRLDESLQLAWYTGWEGYDAQSHIAECVIKSSFSLGAKKTILSGSSGGGFAALQVGALVPNSTVVAFNAQTSIYSYLAGGTSLSAQRAYIRTVYPGIVPDHGDGSIRAADWTLDLGPSHSVLRRYSTNVENRVILVQNIEEFHYVDHYLPFLRSVLIGGNSSNLSILEYRGGYVHVPPTPDIFIKSINLARDEQLQKGFLDLDSPSVESPSQFQGPLEFMGDVRSDSIQEPKAEIREEELEPSQAINFLRNEIESLRSEVALLHSKWPSGLGKNVHMDETSVVDPSCHLIADYTLSRITIGKHTKVFRYGEWLGPIVVGNRVFINRNSYIRPNVTIEDDVSLGPFVSLVSDTHEPGTRVRRTGTPIKPPIVIGQGSWIGANVTVLGGVNIGKRVVVMAGSVVTRDVPDNSLVGGVPAKVIKTLDPIED